MTEEIHRLLIVSDVSGGSQTNTKLKKIESQAGSTERATDGLTKSFVALASSLVALVGTYAGLDKLVNSARQFAIFEAGLKTATGSADNASVAFEALEAFAERTPYTLDQSVNAFTKLTNLGLAPSERALLSYGDTAAAMGKDLDQMVEAVADAATGEFERLKEFGIRASAQGDQVEFTFNNVKTTVGKNSKEIEEYLIGLGEINFSGAMAERMATIDGALSNLEDTWDKTFRLINQKGASKVMEDAIRDITDSIGELNRMIESEQLQGYVEAFGSQFTLLGEDFSRTLDILNTLYTDFLNRLGTDTEETVGFLNKAFTQFPENVRSVIQLVTVEIATLFDKLDAYGSDVIERLTPKATPKAVQRGVAALFGVDLDDDSLDTAVTKASGTLEERLKAIDAVRNSSIDLILKERDESLTTTNALIIDADRARKKYEELQEEKRKALEGVDVLSQFGKGGEEPEEEGLSTSEEKARSKRLESLSKLLHTEEENLAVSYSKKAEMAAQDITNEAQRTEVLIELHKWYLSELDSINASEREKFLELSRSKEDNLAYEYSLQAEQAGKLFTDAEQRNAILLGLERRYQEERRKIQEEGLSSEEILWDSGWQGRLSIVQGGVDAISGLLMTGNKKQAEEAKRWGRFSIAASAAIGYAKAFEKGGYVGLIEAGIVTANTQKALNNLESLSYGGGATISGAANSTGPGSNPNYDLTSNPQQPARQSSGTWYLSLPDDYSQPLSQRQVDYMFEQLQEADRRGVRMVFTRNGAVAREFGVS